MLNALPTKALGFTMIELVIGVAIFAIAMAMGVPSYRTWIQNTQIRNAAESIQNGLQRARSEAVKSNTNVYFSLGTGSGWIIATGTPPTTPPTNCTPAGIQPIDCRLSNEGSKNVTVSVLPLGATTLTFGNLGTLVANTDGSARLTQINLTSSSLSTADARNLRVTIGTGSVKMCDPHLAAGAMGACS